MITYQKLPIKKEKQVLKQSDWINEEVFTEQEVQYYKVTKTKEVVEEDITTLENFENIILALQEKKQKFITEIDAEIQKNQEIVNELKKL